MSRAYSGTEAVLLLSNMKPDLVLLDLMLPGLSGEEVLTHIKGIPVIVVSARAEVDKKVSLLLGGAVDYMTKPFDTRELLARIAVQLRAPRQYGDPGILEFEEITLDTKARLVRVGEEPLRLTRTEYAILKLLMQNQNQVISKSLLLERISDDTPDCTESSLKVHVGNLRKKLREASGKDYIESVWGIGFQMKSV